MKTISFSKCDVIRYSTLESLFLTSIVDAKERRDIMTCDIPNAFIQASMPAIDNGGEKVMMKMTGILLELLLELAPETYGPYVVFENGKKGSLPPSFESPVWHVGSCLDLVSQVL